MYPRLCGTDAPDEKRQAQMALKRLRHRWQGANKVETPNLAADA
jgi:hypothetical protein